MTLAENAGAAAALLTALAGLIAALVTLIRVRAEVRQLRDGQSRLETELTPNHGSSTRDAVDRAETAATHTRDALAELRTELLGEIHGIRRAIGRLADADADLRRDQHAHNQRIHTRIDTIESQAHKGKPHA